FTLLHGSGLISHASPFFFSSICLCPTRSPLFPYTTLFRSCDVLLAVGARFDDRVINGAAKFCPNAKIIHIDIDPASISKTIKARSEEHTSELQSRFDLVCRLLLEKKNNTPNTSRSLARQLL